MKKNISINANGYNIDLITNGVDNFNKIILCFHGFNGDKWGGPFGGLKERLKTSLVCSFDSCGHGDSEVTPEKMRLSDILEEIKVVVDYLKKTFHKPIVLVANSYGAYRVMWYLIKFKPSIEQVVFVNPAFRILKILETIRGFEYVNLNSNEMVLMKGDSNKFLNKKFLDDLNECDLYKNFYDIDYDIKIVVGIRDSLIPVEDTLEIAGKYNFEITYIDEEHRFENKENWNVIADMISEFKE